jgi:hypothetical protein
MTEEDKEFMAGVLGPYAPLFFGDSYISHKSDMTIPKAVHIVIPGELYIQCELDKDDVVIIWDRNVRGVANHHINKYALADPECIYKVQQELVRLFQKGQKIIMGRHHIDPDCAPDIDFLMRSE